MAASLSANPTHPMANAATSDSEFQSSCMDQQPDIEFFSGLITSSGHDLFCYPGHGVRSAVPMKGKSCGSHSSPQLASLLSKVVSVLANTLQPLIVIEKAGNFIMALEQLQEVMHVKWHVRQNLQSPGLTLHQQNMQAFSHSPGSPISGHHPSRSINFLCILRRYLTGTSLYFLLHCKSISFGGRSSAFYIPVAQA